MTPFTELSALACPLPQENVDTDRLIPARFMKESRDKGYGRFLLHDMRFDEDGTATDFVLNHPRAKGSEILVARRNFGAGSSREAAVYALVDYGFRCVIAPSFGDIFSSNSVNNGLLPAVVSEQDAERLLALLDEGPDEIHVDLERQRITAFGESFPFEIDATWKIKLLNGWDDIDLTRARHDEIEAFRNAYTAAHPWTRPE